jgi:WD40 repeat protein
MKIGRQFAVGILLVLGTGLFGIRVEADSRSNGTAERVFEIKNPAENEKAPVISAVTLDPQGMVLASVGDDHQVRIWSLESGTVLNRLEAHTDWVRAAAFRPDGKVLATAGDDHVIRLWDLSSRASPQALPELPHVIRALAYSPHGKKLAAAGFGPKVYLYDGISGSLLQELHAPDADIRAVRFSPEGTQLAAGGRSGVLRVWNMDGSLRFDVQVSSRCLWAVAYSPDGKQIAVAGEERVPRIYDAATGKPLAALPEQPAEVRALCYCTPDVLAAGGTDNRIRLWSVSTGRMQRQLEGHTGTVNTLTYDAPRGELISAGFDTTIRTWRIVPTEEKVSRR